MANQNSWAASAKSRREIAEKKFWDFVSQKYGDKYDFSKFRYLGATTKSEVVCRDHGSVFTSPTYILAGAICPRCSRESAGKSKRLGWDVFVKKAQHAHNNKYEYPEQEYVGNKAKVRIICKKHGEFWQKPNSHMYGKGCYECANDLKRERNKAVSNMVKEDLLNRLGPVNPLWTYDLSTYKGMAKNMRAICSEHGDFWSQPNNILYNRGCPECGKEKHAKFSMSRQLTTEEWISKAKQVHGNKYSYKDTVYLGADIKTKVTCLKHGPFFTTNDHIHQETGCPQCANSLSRGELEVFNFVSIFVAAEQRDRKVIRPLELDIYMPENSLAIEYCGEFWHSHGSADEERQNRRKHIHKYELCKAQGIRLLTIYESEWKDRNYAVRRLIRNALGKSKGRLMARKCELKKVTAQKAKEFYDKYHPQGGDGNGEHYALMWKGKMVACMRFVLGANDRGAGATNRSWTLSRYATRITVSGAASRLFRAFLDEHKPLKVKSFSDNRYFSGDMYERLGFVLEEEIDTDYQVWSKKLGLRPKSHYQRRLIPQRLKDHEINDNFDPETDPRAEAEMTYLMGARRIYDCGKKRWLWSLDTPKKEA